MSWFFTEMESGETSTTTTTHNTQWTHFFTFFDTKKPRFLPYKKLGKNCSVLAATTKLELIAKKKIFPLEE